MLNFLLPYIFFIPLLMLCLITAHKTKGCGEEQIFSIITKFFFPCFVALIVLMIIAGLLLE